MTQIPSGPPPAPQPETPSGERPAADSGPRVSSEEVRNLGRLRRTIGPNRKVAGVAGGLARHLDIDPLILRVAMVVLVFFGGAGLIVYGACWLLVPEDGAPRAPFGFDDRNRSIALIIAGVIATLALIGDTVGQVGFPWPLAILGLIALVVVGFFDRDRPRPTAPPIPHTYPGGASAGEQWNYQGGYSTGPAVPGAPTSPASTVSETSTTGYPVGYPTTHSTYVPMTAPRKRGPKLFWFTAALSALAVGVLGIVDLAGVAVADSAYPATVLAICGVMLLVGAFYGRAGGIIFLGLLAAFGTAGATASERWDSPTVLAPLSSAEVRSSYSMGVSEFVLDLTDVRDLESLDGRTIKIELGLGSVDVIVPDDLDITAHAEVGLGDVELLGHKQDGAGIDANAGSGSGIGAPDLALNIQVGLGEVRVVTESASIEGATS